jgi:hypothetical protein
MSTDHHPFVFGADAIKRCDEIATECLGEVTRKKRIKELQSVLYTDNVEGDYLLVCTDGSVLFAPAEIGASLLIAGFKNGLRSNLDAVKRSSSQSVLEASY